MRRILCAIVLFAAITSCTKVPFGEVVDPMSKLVYRLNWKEIGNGDGITRPSSFNMAVTRTIKSQHMIWADLDTAGTAKTDTLELEKGEYQSIIYAAEGEYLYENLELFRDDNSSSIRDVAARLPKLNDSLFRADYGSFEQIFVSYCDTVVAAPRLFRSSLRYNLPNKTDSLGISYITYDPEVLSRPVTFRVKINAEEGLKVHRVIATIVGVPLRVELLSGLMDINRDNLGQTLFEMAPSAADSTLYESTVMLLGIMPASSAETISGSGIMQVYIEEGVSHRKIRRIVNLYKYLEENPLLTFTEIEDWAHGGYLPVTYTIETPIILESNTLNSGDGPVSEWIDPDDEVKDIIDGQDEEEEIES